MRTASHLLPVVAATLLLTLAVPVAAQSPAPARSFALEALGGSAGSVAGVGLGVLAFRPDACDGEDIACILEKLGSIGIVTALTSPAGTVLLGRAFDTRPHPLGALLGGLLGVGAGVGALRALDELGAPAEGAGAIVVYGITQGVATALGSRLGAALRRGEH